MQVLFVIMLSPSLSKTPSSESLNSLTLASEISSFGPSTVVEEASADKGLSQIVNAALSDYPELRQCIQDFYQNLTKTQSSEAASPESSCAFLLQFIQFLLDTKVSPSLIDCCLQTLEREILGPDDIHDVLKDLERSSIVRKQALRTFCLATCETSTRPSERSALFRAAKSGSANLLVLFDGQSIENPQCFARFKDIYFQYETLLEELLTVSDGLLAKLSRLPETRDFYRDQRIDLKLWLEDRRHVPESNVLGTAAFSLPIIGLIGLAHYCVTCKLLNKTPGDLRSALCGTSGHSQGIAIAACIACSDSWESFYNNGQTFLEMLFWIGFESHLATPRSYLSAAAIADSLESGEGQPSSLLSVRGLDRNRLQNLVDRCNNGLEDSEKVYIALVNDKENLVVAGPAKSLKGLNLHLRSIKAGPDEDQSRTPFSQRKPTINHFFLPVSVPFHTAYLTEAASVIKQRMGGKTIFSDEMVIPVYHSATGTDIREGPRANIITTIIDAITIQPVDWPLTLDISNISHIIVFGDGRLVDLAARYREGQGVRVIAGSELESSNDQVGSKGELFTRQLSPQILEPQSWAEKYQPELVPEKSCTLRLDTRLSKLLGLPPVMVGGMTPTTVHSDVVSAIMNAGYHVELAGGGYVDAEAMESAIARVVEAVPSGRGVTCNLIYSSPKAMGWQIPMISRLVKKGVPIDGITVGAGVPSPEIITEYIMKLGLKHIGFKPGSTTAIKQVVAAAKNHPSFPIILQWTGGRGGGHHSFEDFHAPILKTYGDIRRCPNIFLVAGSGFGNAEDSYPYLTGIWACQFGRPAMPFDGILLGSRMMVAKEAHTSPAVKDVIVATTGGSDWEKSYSESVGGIITVKSEMGQPIHKIATRGVRLWREFDQQLFCLPIDKRLSELKRKRKSIIQRLNADFAKPWFGRNYHSDAIDLTDMTYAEVLRRLVELMYIRHQDRWIDPSYSKLVYDFAIRMSERLGDQNQVLSTEADCLLPFVERLEETCPSSVTELLHPEDVAFFVARCKAGGQKPVNFIPILDESFETWFKKDSLWQSEDLDAVVDQDPGRVCILHGPAAAGYSTKSSEPAKSILDGICTRLIKLLRDNDSLMDDLVEDNTLYSTLGAPESSSFGWVDAILNEEVMLQGSKRIVNPIWRLLNSWSASQIKTERGRSLIRVMYERGGETEVAARIHSKDGQDIAVELLHSRHEYCEPSVLKFFFNYDKTKVIKLSESMGGRNTRIQTFYKDLWLNRELNASRNLHSMFYGNEVLLDAKLLQGMALTISNVHADLGHSTSGALPIDICVKLAWDVLMQPLLVSDFDCDLLRLVHKSNTFEYYPGAKPLRVGDIISSSSRVLAIRIDEAGKSIVIQATIARSGRAVAHVTSEFLVKGAFTDYQNTFEDKKEPQMEMHINSDIEETVLRSRDWINLEDYSLPLKGKTLCFQLTTSVRWKDRSSYRNLSVKGRVYEKHGDNQRTNIGFCSFLATDCTGNPVVDFLQRHASPTSPIVPLKNSGFSDGPSLLDITVPKSNESYARFSTDFNPIHVSPLFASWAELPGTIVHGMFTSAVSRAVAEHFLEDSEYARFKRYNARFTGMVTPGDEISISLEHTAMIEGRMLIKIEAANKASGDKILDGEAEVEQDKTMYMFTGQGSQEPNMGMALYESSTAARMVWEKADKHLQDKFGMVQRNLGFFTC